MNIKRKMGLGKGLGSLLGDPVEAEVVEVKEETNVSFEIAIDSIETNPYQPRTQFNDEALEELRDSIRMQGVIQPIAVRQIGERYQLISGERRLKASKLAGLKTIPAYVREATDNQMLELGLIENIQRENLNPMEIAIAYRRLLEECSIRQEDLGNRVGKDRSTVNNYLRLLNLPDYVQEGLAEKLLSMGHARALLGLDNENHVMRVYSEILNNQLSVRKVEEMVKSLNSGSKVISSANKPNGKTAGPKRNLDSYQDIFADIFQRKVMVQADELNKGEIKISYNSKAELEQIIEKIKK